MQDDNKLGLKHIIITTICSLMSALLSSSLIALYASDLSARNQAKDRARTHEETILFKRIELIDRVTKMVGRSTSLGKTFEIYDHDLKENKANLEALRQMTEISSECMSVKIMSALFFGPKTKAQTERITCSEFFQNKPPDKAYSEWIVAMNEELYFNLDWK